MSVKKKIKDSVDKIKSRIFKKREDAPDAEEVAREHALTEDKRAKNPSHSEHAMDNVTEKKAPAKRTRTQRTRPTNGAYKMIDPDDDTCDSSKS